MSHGPPLLISDKCENLKRNAVDGSLLTSPEYAKQKAAPYGLMAKYANATRKQDLTHIYSQEGEWTAFPRLTLS